MKLGNKNFLIITFYFLFLNISFAEEKITSTPLINVDEIKPSFEILEGENESISTQNLKEKKNNKSLKSFQAVVKINNKIDSVAYMQVKDLTKNDNEKVFIFNGWTFASDPSLTPFDHAIYDLQLVNCNTA